MEQKVIELVYNVIDEMKDSKQYKRLLALKSQIETDPTIQDKIQQFRRWNEKYNDVKQYGKYHPDLKSTMQAFREAKMNLYNDQIVAEYKQLEQQIQQELDSISTSVAEAISAKIKHPNEVGMIKRH